jgi:RND family efflux transporter MFP subunit
MKRLSIFAASFIVLCALAACVGGAIVVAGDDYEAFTKPSEDITRAFARPGLIDKVLVKEGDAIEVGQLLVQMDDSAEQANLAQLKAQAEEDVRVKAAAAELEQKKVDLKKTEFAKERNAASDMEVEHARLDVVIAELTLKLAEFQHKMDALKYDEAKAELARMRLTSPIKGRVEQVLVRQGESVNTADKVIRLVSTDPLWIDVPVPLARVRALGLDRYRMEPKTATVEAGPESGHTAGQTLKGKVIHVAAVADPGSSTLLVRIEAQNPTGRQAGEQVKVRFDARSAAAPSTQPTMASSQPAGSK